MCIQVLYRTGDSHPSVLYRQYVPQQFQLSGTFKENTQSGAELIGDGSVEADAEMLALSAQLLKAAGLKEFQLSVGHADFLRGLFEAAGLDEDVMEEIRNLLQNRNLYGVQEVVAQYVTDEV